MIRNTAWWIAIISGIVLLTFLYLLVGIKEWVEEQHSKE